MEGQTNRQLNKRVYGCMDRQTDEQKGLWMDEWMDRQMDKGFMHGWMDRPCKRGSFRQQKEGQRKTSKKRRI